MSLREILKSKDNNYQSIEDKFKINTGNDLLSMDNWANSRIELTRGLSIVIPTYNSNDSLNGTLGAISRQIDDEIQDLIEVVIIDDASLVPAFETCMDFQDALQITYLRQSRNLSAGPTRRNGVKAAKFEDILFLDSDVIPSDGLIKNHMYLHNALPNQALLVGFQETANSDDIRFSASNLPNDEIDTRNKDFRRSVRVRADWNPPMEEVDKEYQLLEQTNYFKEFGEGRKIGLWTLPMMALTLCMSASRKALLETGGAPTGLKGWGWNDTTVAARLLGWGIYLVPNLNSAVLQKKHDIRLGDFANKRRSFFYNQGVYEEMLDSEFHTHRLNLNVPI